MNETEPATDESPTSAELHAQLRELGERYPHPTWEDVLPDWKWVHAWGADPSLPPERPQKDCWVAVLNGRIVGMGPDPVVLRLAKARELDVHPERLVLSYALGYEPW